MPATSVRSKPAPQIGHLGQAHGQLARLIALHFLQFAARNKPVADIKFDRIIDAAVQRQNRVAARRNRSRTKGRALPTEIVTSIGTWENGLVSGSSSICFFLFWNFKEAAHSGGDFGSGAIKIDSGFDIAQP